MAFENHQNSHRDTEREEDDQSDLTEGDTSIVGEEAENWSFGSCVFTEKEDKPQNDEGYSDRVFVDF